MLSGENKPFKCVFELGYKTLLPFGEAGRQKLSYKIDVKKRNRSREKLYGDMNEQTDKDI
jgi:hypothetical protein